MDIHQYNDYSQHKFCILFVELTVGFVVVKVELVVLVVDLTASASVGWSFYIYSG